MSSLGLLYDAAEENARGYGRKIGLKIVKPDEDSASTENAAKKVLLHQNQMQQHFIYAKGSLADLNAQLEFKVAENLLDEAVNLLRRQGLGVRLEGEAEGHALFARTQLFTAVDVKQLDLDKLLAGALHLAYEGAALHAFRGYKRQIALYRSQRRDGLVVDGGGYQRVEGHPVNLAQIDVQVAAAILGQLELGGDIVGQLAENADTLPLAEDIGGDAGMQPCNIGRTRNGQLDTKCRAEAFDRALNGKEVLLAAPCGKAKMQAFLRQLGDGLLLRMVR